MRIFWFLSSELNEHLGENETFDDVSFNFYHHFFWHFITKQFILIKDSKENENNIEMCEISFVNK